MDQGKDSAPSSPQQLIAEMSRSYFGGDTKGVLDRIVELDHIDINGKKAIDGPNIQKLLIKLGHDPRLQDALRKKLDEKGLGKEQAARLLSSMGLQDSLRFADIQTLPEAPPKPNIVDIPTPHRSRRKILAAAIGTAAALTLASLPFASSLLHAQTKPTSANIANLEWKEFSKAVPLTLDESYFAAQNINFEPLMDSDQSQLTPAAPAKTPTATISATPLIEISTPTQTSQPTATPTVSPTVTESPTPSPSPTPDVIKIAQKETGNVNLAEFFLGKTIEKFKQKRLERYNSDPSFAERIKGLDGTEQEKFQRAENAINSDTIHLVYLGIDNTRERFNEFNDQGWGRSDIVMMVNFNPHTFEVSSVSLPRDMYAPELYKFGFTGGARINSATMASYVDKDAKPFELMHQIIESATGVPVDGIIQTNIDFMQGWTDQDGVSHPGIFDSMSPDGVPINVTDHVVDDEYPVGYGTVKIDFRPGQQTLHGAQITQYARSRHSDSDFGRSERQRQVLLSFALKSIGPNIIKEFITGNTQTLDKLIETLEREQSETNISTDFDFLQILKDTRAGVQNIRNEGLLGVAKLGIMGGRSLDLVTRYISNPSSVFKSLGATRADALVENVSSNEKGYWPYMLKVEGSSTASHPTELGNYLNYWKSMRDKLQDFVN